MNRWEGRVALVTGASAGIGAAMCEVLVESGMKVVGAARDLNKMQDLANKLKEKKGSFLPIKCDLTKDGDIYALFETIKKEYGGVDICINNAGLSYDKSLLDGRPDEWREVLNVNVIALCLCTKLSVASMRERGVDDGHIINIGSLSGHIIIPKPSLHFYTGTKFAVRALTESFRQELREANSHIRVSLISPGVVKTEFIERMYNGNKEKAENFYSAFEVMQPDDLKDTLLYVISSPPHVQVDDIMIQPTEQGFLI